MSFYIKDSHKRENNVSKYKWEFKNKAERRSIYTKNTIYKK